MDRFWQDLYIVAALRQWRAKAAATQAANRCNKAGEAARHAANSVRAPGNDVRRRDAAALRALDASERCAAASVEALKVAARCEGEAILGVVEAAAARCDVDGATAAAAAADGFALSCAAACARAAAPTSAAREAAARCVLARDAVPTAEWVARKATLNSGTNWEAYRESADFHKKAYNDAVEAALAAGKAAVHCATASHRAVLAASVARKVAVRCDRAGGAGAAAAAAEARRAADLCIADTVSAVDAAVLAANSRLAVPLADGAASEAREAAAKCDSAYLAPGEDDKDYLDKMLGWLMTVAALFVTIAFQAILNIPAGVSSDFCFSKSKAASGVKVWPGCLYMYFNTFTMAGAVAVVVMLLTMKKNTSTLRGVKLLLFLISFTVAASFITSMGNWGRVLAASCVYFFIINFLISLRTNFLDKF